MTSALSALRTHFEQALLDWLRSDTTQPFINEKHQILQALYDCIVQLKQEIEPHEPYWQYAQTVFHALLENQLIDQIICRKLVAKINLLIAQKIQQTPSLLAPKELWKDTLMLLSNTDRKAKLTTITDSFLYDAEDCLQRLDLSNIDWQPTTFEVILSQAKTMHSLAIEIDFDLLTILAKALANLLATFQQLSICSINENERLALKTTQQSMRSLLHQAAAGISPKQDDLFIEALFICEQVAAIHRSNIHQ